MKFSLDWFLGFDPFSTRSDDEVSLLGEMIGERVAEPAGNAGDDDRRILISVTILDNMSVITTCMPAHLREMRDELGTEHGVHEAGVAEVVGHEA